MWTRRNTTIIRGREKAWQRMLRTAEAIEPLRRRFPNLIVHTLTTLMKENQDEILEIYEELKQPFPARRPVVQLLPRHAARSAADRDPARKLRETAAAYGAGFFRRPASRRRANRIRRGQPLARSTRAADRRPHCGRAAGAVLVRFRTPRRCDLQRRRRRRMRDQEQQASATYVTLTTTSGGCGSASAPARSLGRRRRAVSARMNAATTPRRFTACRRL